MGKIGNNKVNINIQLKGVSLFSRLGDGNLEMLCNRGLIRNFPKGSTIVSQGTNGDTFYVIVSGRAKVVLLNEDGKEIILTYLKEGDFFGELSLLDDEPRSASIITTEDTTLFLLAQKQFYEMMKSYPDILRTVLKEICRRLRCADEKIGGLAFLDVYNRTLRVLQQLSRDQGTKTNDGIEILHAPTHQDLAFMVGASREAITRIIKALKKNKTVVSYKDRRLILKDF